jgi:hypothetical protein
LFKAKKMKVLVASDSNVRLAFGETAVIAPGRIRQFLLTTRQCVGVPKRQKVGHGVSDPTIGSNVAICLGAYGHQELPDANMSFTPSGQCQCFAEPAVTREVHLIEDSMALPRVWFWCFHVPK